MTSENANRGFIQDCRGSPNIILFSNENTKNIKEKMEPPASQALRVVRVQLLTCVWRRAGCQIQVSEK